MVVSLQGLFNVKNKFRPKFPNFKDFIVVTSNYRTFPIRYLPVYKFATRNSSLWFSIAPRVFSKISYVTHNCPTFAMNSIHRMCPTVVRYMSIVVWPYLFQHSKLSGWQPSYSLTCGLSRSPLSEAAPAPYYNSKTAGPRIRFRFNFPSWIRIQEEKVKRY